MPMHGTEQTAKLVLHFREEVYKYIEEQAKELDLFPMQLVRGLLTFCCERGIRLTNLDIILEDCLASPSSPRPSMRPPHNQDIKLIIEKTRKALEKIEIEA